MKFLASGSSSASNRSHEPRLDLPRKPKIDLNEEPTFEEARRNNPFNNDLNLFSYRSSDDFGLAERRYEIEEEQIFKVFFTLFLCCLLFSFDL